MTTTSFLCSVCSDEVALCLSLRSLELVNKIVSKCNIKIMELIVKCGLLAYGGLEGVMGLCIFMDLKIQSKSSVIGSTISKFNFKYGVINYMIFKQILESSVIECY